MRIAVVGAGVSGLVSAYLLHRDHEVTVFEAEDRLGGHTHTIDVEGPDGTTPVDTGFIVFNEHNYPNFTRLLAELGVKSQPTLMGFSVRDDRTGLEYAGKDLNTLFAQRRNLFRPSFHRMIRDILRFYEESPEVLAAGAAPETIGEYLARRGYSREFAEHHILPMGAALWSAGNGRVRDIPARFFVGFMDNHRMLIRGERPLWRVIQGGSREYVRALTAGFQDRIRLATPVQWIRRELGGVTLKPRDAEPERFDEVILACHSDQSLRLLQDPTPREREILGAIPYQPNDVVLHTDVSLLPKSRRAWSAWNVSITGDSEENATATYYMNHLQSLRTSQDYCVTLNQTQRVDPDRRLRELVYDHPVFTEAGVRMRANRDAIDGVNHTHYCGAYWGYGFHEDGVASALTVCKRFEQVLV